jgi:hypothetical protein
MNNTNVYSFEIKFYNKNNNKSVKFHVFSQEKEWGFAQLGSFRSEYETKYYGSTAEFLKAINKYLSNPSATIGRIDTISEKGTEIKAYDCWTAEGSAESRKAAMELINKVN